MLASAVHNWPLKQIRFMSYKTMLNTAISSEIAKIDVWNIFTPLANEQRSINLGQGFPSFPVADFIKVRWNFNSTIILYFLK